MSNPESLMYGHFFKSSLASRLHRTAMAASPWEVMLGHPRLSNVCNNEHLDNETKDLSVMSLQYDMLIVSR